MSFEEFIEDRNRIFDFYGVCGNEFKLDGTVWEAVENECDGYRSMLDSIQRKDSDGIFFGWPVARVRVESIYVRYEFEGYHLVDEDGHVWLEFGTNRMGDYYPCFTFRYTPKEA